MKILMLNYEFPPLGGGASPVSYEIAKGYVKLGHFVDVVTMGFKGLPAYEKVDGIKVYRVPCIRSKKEICYPHEMFTYIISAKHFLKNHLKTHKYDINHTHFIIPTGIVALWVKKKFNIPYIITSHGSDVIGYNKRFKYVYPFLVRPWKKIVKEAKAVTTPSKYLQNEIKKITTEGNFVVIPNGIDPKKFKPMKKEKYILCVSRLFVNKGIQDLLKALEGLDLGGWKVKIVGDGPYKEELLRLRKEYKLEDSVEFLGWVDNRSDKMKKLYGHASIFVSCSYFESFGLTVLEAISAGCYPLISDIPGYQQLDLNKKHYFQIKNANDLINRLTLLINNNKRLNIENFDNKFEWGKMIMKYKRVIK